MTPPQISVILPCLDEEQNIAGVLEKALYVLDTLGEPFEVLVVDDGSRDATSARATAAAAGRPEVRVLRHESNRGYGAALRTGLGAAAGEWLFFTDGDGQFDIRDLGELWARRREADIVTGYRRRRRDPAMRRFMGRLSTLLARWLLGVRVRDLNCAFKLFRRDLYERIELREEGALVNAELLAQARILGARVLEIPVTHLPRRAGSQTGGSPRVIGSAAVQLLRLWFRLR